MEMINKIKLLRNKDYRCHLRNNNKDLKVNINEQESAIILIESQQAIKSKYTNMFLKAYQWITKNINSIISTICFIFKYIIFHKE